MGLTFATHARADGNDNKAAAQVIFEQGRDLALRKDFTAACPKFQESLRLDPGIGTMLWLADCYENTGQTASAWAEFKEAAAAAALQHDARESIARRRAAGLESRLSRLVILVPTESLVAGLEVRRDGVVVSTSEYGVALPVNPGMHALAASAPDRAAWSSTVTIPQQTGSTPVTIPVLAAAAASNAAGGAVVGSTTSTAPGSSGDTASAPASDQPAPVRAPGASQRTAGLILGGAGIVSLGAGVFFGLRAKSTYDDAQNSGNCLPDNECNAAGKQQRSDAHGLATVSTVTFVLGVAAVAGGAVLYFTAPRGSSQTTVGAAPTSGGAALVVSHAW